MRVDELETILYDEWRKSLTNVLDCCANNSDFDKLYDMRQELYDLFYPLGIGSCNAEDVTRIFKEIEYADKDDGDLSLVAAYAINKNKDYKYSLSPIIFVTFGCYNELTDELVEKYTFYHHTKYNGYTINLIKYEACSFNCEQLNKIYELKPKYDLLHNYAKRNDNKNYFKIKREIESDLINIIRNNKSYKCKELIKEVIANE